MLNLTKTMNDQNNFQTAVDAGAALCDARELHAGKYESAPYVVLPKDYTVETLEKLLPAPLIKRQVVNFGEAASFARYVTDHGDAARTVLFAQPTAAGGQFVAVLDYHEPRGAASWCAHRAAFNCPLSPLWQLWSRTNNTYMVQRDFAEFLESNTAQIVMPPAAEFLEIAQTLTARSTVAFTGSARLDNGRDQITFESTTETKVGEKGNLTLPPVFTIGLPVFEGGPSWQVKARLRHRISDHKKLELKYELVNPQLTVRAAWDEQVNIIRKATKLEPYIGTL